MMAKAPANWWEHLIVNDKGKPLPLLANAITALNHATEFQGLLKFDAFHQKPVITGKAPWMTDSVEQDEWTSLHDVLTANWLQHQGIHVSPEITGQAVDAISRENRFHPVIDYLGRCVWDGKDRLDGWAVRYLGVDESPFAAAAAARWMIAAVARVTAPGCKADCALILEGPQGSLKSTALKTLSTPWFTDEVADLGTKDAAMQLAGRWVLELAELDSMSRSDVSKTKAFMSRTTDRFRPPYGRRVIEVPRQCVFAGTVNHTEYLRDETGGRRFWPITCGKIDIDALRADRDQLWAEARDRYLAGESWWIDSAPLDADAREAQRARYQADAWEETIHDWLGVHQSASVAEILEHAFGLRPSEWGQTEQNRVARCLHSLGWERYQQREGLKRIWRYRPVSPASPGGA